MKPERPVDYRPTPEPRIGQENALDMLTRLVSATVHASTFDAELLSSFLYVAEISSFCESVGAQKSLCRSLKCLRNQMVQTTEPPSDVPAAGGAANPVPNRTPDALGALVMWLIQSKPTGGANEAAPVLRQLVFFGLFLCFRAYFDALQAQNRIGVCSLDEFCNKVAEAIARQEEDRRPAGWQLFNDRATLTMQQHMRIMLLIVSVWFDQDLAFLDRCDTMEQIGFVMGLPPHLEGLLLEWSSCCDIGRYGEFERLVDPCSIVQQLRISSCCPSVTTNWRITLVNSSARRAALDHPLPASVSPVDRLFVSCRTAARRTILENATNTCGTVRTRT